MCTDGVNSFVMDHLSEVDVRGSRVLEVGSHDWDGLGRSALTRLFIEGLGSRSYVGVDIQEGPGVDVVADISSLIDRFGKEAFDVVITTEVLEHVEDWRSAFGNLKDVLAPGGLLVLTTRSKGFGYHGYPHDFWRYEPDDIRVILNDLDIDAIDSDTPAEPGVFVRARKPLQPRPQIVPLEAYALYSIVMNRRVLEVPSAAKLAAKTLFPVWTAIKPHLPAEFVSAVRRWSGRAVPTSDS